MRDADDGVDLPVRCACGRVRGVAERISRRTTSHLFCYCKDCRAYAHFLERAELLDAAGGTDIVQMARSRLRILSGEDALACVRLSPKGLHRWYAACCRTPIANTVPAIPFAGMPVAFFDPARPFDRDILLGPAAPIHTASATGPLPPHARVPVRAILKATGLLVRWWWSERRAPSAFFDARARAPRVAPRVLTPDERPGPGVGSG
jgi:hypothetical protein